MSAFWKFIMSLYNLFLIAVALMAVAVATGYEEPMKWINAAFANPQNRIITGLVGALFVLLGLNLLMQGLRTPKKIDMVIQESPDGPVTITVPAVKQIVLKAVKLIEGVREVKPEISNGKRGVQVHLTIMVNPDHKLPELTTAIQDKVREYLEQLAGLRVAEIKVTVDDLATKPTAR
ncbi:MAG: alkaline shock response membrane anchor protein AmaP [Ignavibacteriales bacterium]